MLGRGISGFTSELGLIEPEGPESLTEAGGAATSRRRSTEDRAERVERLIYQGMARGWAEAELYGEADVMGVGA